MFSKLQQGSLVLAICRLAPEEIEQKIESKLEEFIQSQGFKEAVRKALNNNSNEVYSSKIVTTEQELIRLANKGYSCIPIVEGKWLMRKKYN